MFHRPTTVVVRDPTAGFSAVAAQAEAREAKSDVDGLRFDVERLLMVTEALWMILKEQLGYTDDELYRRVAEIDMRDGKLDGKVAKTQPATCPHCNRTIIGRRPTCLYCGQAVSPDLFKR